MDDMGHIESWSPLGTRDAAGERLPSDYLPGPSWDEIIDLS